MTLTSFGLDKHLYTKKQPKNKDSQYVVFS